MRQERQGKCSAAMAAGALPSLSGTALQQHQAAVYFGLSCALATLRRVAVPCQDAGGCDLGARQRQCRWSRAREVALQGKIGELELQVEELRRRRAEDARANEKVAGIFAAHEQRWFAERKSLRRQVQAVVAAARAREVKHDEATATLGRQLEDQKRAAALKDEATEQETRRREEALRTSEQAAEELRERARKDAQEHAADMKRHKASFVELASAQRQLEAELARAARRADLAEAELKAALERREEAVATAAELSLEAARLRRDAEHKDKILSAMLRKSKIDMEDREMLVREVKMCKARRKQAELEAERWRKMWESRHRRGSSRSSAQRCGALDHTGCSHKMNAADTKILFVDHVEEGKKGRVAPELTTVECVDCYGSNVDDKPVVEEYKELQEWFHMETGKYTTMIRQRHGAELEAFTEQLRLKDEKLEAFRWRAVSMDVEAARLRCRIQELEGRLSHHEQHGAGIEALLLDGENENTSLKEKLRSQALDSESISPTVADDFEGSKNSNEHCIPCSPVKIQTTDSGPEGNEITTYAGHDHAKIIELSESVPLDDCKTSAARGSIDEGHRTVPTDHSCRSEIEEEKEAYADPGKKRARPSSSTASSEEARSEAPEQKPSACRVDIHALAVSYKIKRLKQQQLALEKLAAAAAAEGGTEGATMSSNGSGCRQDPRSYQLMISFVSKHVKRYQSLEDKIQDLSTRMEESKRSGGRGQEGGREQNVALARFLEETFQLQRYMVATGQKLLEMQSRIATTLARAAVDSGGGGIGDRGDGVDTGRFMDVVGALLRDVQRGLELRIARIIGDLEGTLTFHGILQTTF